MRARAADARAQAHDGQDATGANAIAAEAVAAGHRVYDLVLRKGRLSRQALDDLLRPEIMLAPGLGHRLLDAGRPSAPASTVPAKT